MPSTSTGLNNLGVSCTESNRSLNVETAATTSSVSNLSPSAASFRAASGQSQSSSSELSSSGSYSAPGSADSTLQRPVQWPPGGPLQSGPAFQTRGGGSARHRVYAGAAERERFLLAFSSPLAGPPQPASSNALSPITSPLKQSLAREAGYLNCIQTMLTQASNLLLLRLSTETAFNNKQLLEDQVVSVIFLEAILSFLYTKYCMLRLYDNFNEYEYTYSRE